jgi:hypothetical protein
MGEAILQQPIPLHPEDWGSRFPETLVSIYQTVRSHIPEEGGRVINLDAAVLTFLLHEVSPLPVIKLQEC